MARRTFTVDNSNSASNSCASALTPNKMEGSRFLFSKCMKWKNSNIRSCCVIMRTSYVNQGLYYSVFKSPLGTEGTLKVFCSKPMVST